MHVSWFHSIQKVCLIYGGLDDGWLAISGSTGARLGASLGLNRHRVAVESPPASPSPSPCQSSLNVGNVCDIGASDNSVKCN